LPLTSRKDKRDFVYVEDAVRAHLLAATGPIMASGIFNIGTSVETTLEEVVQAIERRTSKKIRVEEGAYESRQWASPCWAADVRLAGEILGWKPAHDLEAGLRKTIAWAEARRQAKLATKWSIP